MKVEKLAWTQSAGWHCERGAEPAQLVLYFGSRETLTAGNWFADLENKFPGAHLIGCSSASQIAGFDIVEDGIAGVALSFANARIRAEAVDITGAAASRDSGAELGRRLAADDLAGILVLSDGLMVNGSELTRGIASQIPDGIRVSGGLAADGANFVQTLVGLDEAPRPGRIAAIGFYGGAVHLTTGSAGGWAEFGPRREITHSEANVLYALDGEPALDLYEHYLGEEDAKALPSSGLLFPLKVFDPAHPEHSVVRTILAVDRDARSMTFAGDVPQGWVAQLMRGNVDRLVNGAADAARQIVADGALPAHSLVLMVSCIGRRLLMGQRTIDEVEAAGAELGDNAIKLGFYSYGEICPHEVSGRGEMHNQTMTITAISEAA